MGQLNYTTEKTNELLEKVNDMPETVTDGKTPVLETGTTTTLDPGQNATSEVVANGMDDEGNPKYKLNFGIPKGYDGSGGSGGGGMADSVQWANVLNKPTWVNSSTKPAYTASEVGALPSDTQIPSKTSQLTNDSGFTTSVSFKTINGQSIVGSGDIVIEGGGGGSIPSEGGGNVNVTNGSALQSANYYAFKPSADGSLDGTFSVIPNANESTPGLMSKENYSKLDDMKQVWKIPVAVLELTDNSASDEIVTAFGLELSKLQAYIIYSASAITRSEYSNTVPLKCFIGNRECLLSGSIADNAYTLDFNYVDSGKLKIISITYDSSASQFSCKLSESGGGTADDTYWLPNSVYSLSAGATKEEILAALGDTGALSKAVNEGKKIYVKGAYLFSYVSVPVSVSILNDILIISFPFVSNINSQASQKVIENHASGGGVKIIYTEGYKLESSVFDLTSLSESADISTALGGETGLKNITQAIKDGNRLVMDYDLSGIQFKLDLSSPFCQISENGDMMFGFTLSAHMIMYYVRRVYAINYTKTSNTFEANVENLT